MIDKAIRMHRRFDRYSSRSFMALVLEKAREVATMEEVPVAAMIVNKEGDILSLCGNEMRANKDPTAHAEMLAIRKACKKIGQQRLAHHTMIVSLEPCAMCAAAIAHARICRLVFGAYDPKGGGVTHGVKFFDRHTQIPKIEIISGVLEEESAALLRDFFQKLRK